MKRVLQFYSIILYWIAIGAIGFIFATTGIDKLINHDVFYFQLTLSPLQAVRDLAAVLSWLVPISQLVLVALLFIDRLRIYGLYLLLLLVSGYTLYIGGLLVSGEPLPCSCAGIKSGISWTLQFWINITILAVLTGCSYFEKAKLIPRQRTSHMLRTDVLHGQGARHVTFIHSLTKTEKL